jgi:dihydroorotate dehydrogenase (NAD+) catalytic subunit
MSENTDAAVELAPNHKTGLTLPNLVMPAAGCFGLGTEYARLVKTEALGAVVVGPVTAGPRRGASPPRIAPIPGGVLLHTGLANPGIGAAIRRYARAWSRFPVPIIVHVAGTSPGEAASCCHRLASIEAVAGIELGLPDTVDGSAEPSGGAAGRGLAKALDNAIAIIQAAYTAARQPLIVRLPLVSASSLCQAAVEAGASALTIAAPPRGTVWLSASTEPDSVLPSPIWRESRGRFITGRLYGPSVLPLALRSIRRTADLVSVPLIGCGGIYSAADAQAFLHAGAAAVQVDAAVWRDPSCLAQIARSLSPTDIPR